MKILGITVLSIIFFFACSPAKSKSLEENAKVKKATNAAPIMQEDTTFQFTNSKLGQLPSGWSQYFTGKGESTEWKILDDNGNKVLAQISYDNPNYHFNEIVFDGFKVKNVELTVKMKGVNGSKDQGGGFVWRFMDADNYYVVRANPLEDNVVLYKVVNGKRTDLPLLGKGRTYGVDVEPLGNGWNTLKLSVIDNLFTVYLNDKKIFTVEDKTFTTAGKIGLWTKADAVSYFDDLTVRKLN